MTDDSGPKAAGCLITVYDIPRIFATLSILGGQLGAGSCTVTLGVSIPFLAMKLSMGAEDIGRLFIVAGIGYFLGALLSAKYLEIIYNNTLSKTLLGALSICACGIGQLVAVWSDSFAVIAVMVLIMFAGMGAVDNFTTIALSEMWGQRVQPWMQSRSAAYSCGSMVPMVLIQRHSIDYTATFAALLCFSSLVGVIAEFLLFAFQCSCQEPSSLSSNIDSESTELISMIRSRNTSTCSDHSKLANGTITEAVYRRTIDKQAKYSYQTLNDISPIESMSREETRERSVSAVQVINQFIAPIIEHEEILSTELALLGQVLAAEISNNENHDEEALSKSSISHPRSITDTNYQGNQSGDNYQQNGYIDEDIVRNVLDATEYCQVSEENRADPLFEPRINRTLSFVPESIKKQLEVLEEREQLEQQDLTNDKSSTYQHHKPVIALLPLSVRLCIACIILLQMGLSSTMSSWLPVFITINGIGTGDSREGGYVGSLYYMALSIGALVSIPMSVVFSTTTLIRLHIFLVSFGVCLIGISAALFVGVPSILLSLLCGGCMIMGFGMSIIVPLSLTVVNDYGFTMDPSAVATGIMGGAIGSATVPTLVGYIVADAPRNGFWVCILVLGLMLGAFYGAVHSTLSILQKNNKESAHTTINIVKNVTPNRSSRSFSYGRNEESDATMNSYQKARKRTLSIIVDE